MTGAKISTKGIWGMRVDSNPPISISRPLVVQNHNPALRRDVCLVMIGGFELTRIPQIPLVEIFALVETFFCAYFKCLWLRFLYRLKLSWNFYWKICFKFCILEQIIATVLFICFSSVNNKRSLLRFQSTMAPTNRGWSACDTSRFDMNSSSEITQKFGLLQINFAAEREKHFGWIFFVL